MLLEILDQIYRGSMQGPQEAKLLWPVVPGITWTSVHDWHPGPHLAVLVFPGIKLNSAACKACT